MRIFYLLLFILLSLLIITLIAAIAPEVPNATGIPHPEFNGMFVGPANIDQQPHTRWLGYLFGLGVIALFGVMLFIGNRKKGKITPIGKWLSIGITAYLFVYTAMVISHWSYSANEGGTFIFSMPVPTAWMIFGAWFVPLIITVAYVTKFDDSIISEEEIKDFHTFLAEGKDKED